MSEYKAEMVRIVWVWNLVSRPQRRTWLGLVIKREYRDKLVFRTMKRRELCNLHSSPDVIKVTKSRRVS